MLRDQAVCRNQLLQAMKLIKLSKLIHYICSAGFDAVHVFKQESWSSMIELHGLNLVVVENLSIEYIEHCEPT